MTVKPPALDLFEMRPLVEVSSLFRDWEMDSIQTEYGRSFCSLHSLRFEDLTVIRTIESNGSVNEYAPPEGTTAFSFSSADTLQPTWCGMVVPYGMLVINPSGRDYISAQRGRFDAISIVISNDVLDRLEIISNTFMKPGAISDRWMIPLGPRGYRWRVWLTNVFHNPDGLSALAGNPLSIKKFKDAVLLGLANIVQDQMPPRQRKVAKQSRKLALVRQARCMISECTFDVLSVQTLAKELDVSPRALHNMFFDVCGTSPYQYMLSKRLQSVHRELLDARQDCRSISEIACKYGFYELGRFSGYYRRMYGELPSKTRRRLQVSGMQQRKRQ